MTDMASTIVPKSDQWNADDFRAGPQTFTITAVTIKPGEQPVNIALDGTEKFYRPSKSMRRVLTEVWGRDAKAYVGRSLTLFRNPTIKFGPLQTGGIEISHVSHIDAPVSLTLATSRGKFKPFTVAPLVTPNPATQQKQPDLAQLREQARKEASYGRENFAEYWKRLSTPQQQSLKQFTDELKQIAEKADAAMQGAAEPPTPDREPGEDDE